MKCAGKTKHDRPCRGYVRTGSEFCYFHDPASGKLRREAQSKGGRNRSPLLAMPAPPRDFDLKDPENMADLLNLVENRIVRGQMEAKAGNAVAQVVNLALRVNDARERAEQIAQAQRSRDLQLSKSPEKDFLRELAKLHGVEELSNWLTEIRDEQASTVIGDLDGTAA